MMSIYELTQAYLQALFGGLLDRVRDDEDGAVTAEQIVLIGAAVVGAGIVGAIIWSKMQAGANNIPTP
jgi:hypothetical protein